MKFFNTAAASLVLIFAVIAVSAVFAVSCIKDTGNYVYQTSDEIAPNLVSGIAETYSSISMDQLVIDPVMQESDALVDYCWYAYPINNTNVNMHIIDKSMEIGYILFNF